MMPPAAPEILAAMRASLDAFEAPAGVDALDRLVGRLSGLLDALVGQVDNEWLEELRSAWWPLEYVNATALGNDRATLTDVERASLSDARDEFLNLLEES